MIKLTFTLFILLSSICFSQWGPVNPDVFGSNISTINVANGVILAGNAFGVFRSVDDGNSWEYHPLDSTKSLWYPKVRAIIDYNGKYFVASNYGAFISNDKGLNWTQIVIGDSVTHVYDFEKTDSEIYAAAYDGFYISTDSGSTWERRINGLSSPECGSLCVCGEVIYLTIIGPQGNYYSTDKGLNWEFFDNEGYHPIYTSFEDNLFIKEGGSICFFKDYGKTLVEKIWLKNGNFPNINCLLADHDNLFIGTSDGLYVYNLLTNTLDTTVAFNQNVNSLYEKNGIYYLASYSYCYQSKDQGKSWTIKRIGKTNYSTKILFENNGEIITYNGSGNYSSQDNGTTWKVKYPFLINKYVQNLTSTGHNVVANVYPDSVFISIDDGETWRFTKNSTTLKSEVVNFTSVDINYPYLVATSQYGFFYIIRFWSNVG